MSLVVNTLTLVVSLRQLSHCHANVDLCCCRYVWENVEVGYVQGMCDLAAPLLVIFDDGKSRRLVTPS